MPDSTELTTSTASTMQRLFSVIQEEAFNKDETNLVTKQELNEAIEGIGTVMRYKGSVATISALESIVDPEIGDVYNVTATDENFAWNGTTWDKLGSSVDLTGYATETYVGTEIASHAPTDATTSASGLMSAADKVKLDGVEANANNYSLPTMSPTTKGGAKQGDGLSVEDDALNLGPLVKHSTGVTDGSALYGVQGEGWAEQAYYTGKNLIDVTATYISTSGVASRSTSNGNYTLTRAGTASAYDWFLVSGLTVGQQYTLSISGTSEPNVAVYVYNSSGTSRIDWVLGPELSCTFTATETSCRIGMSVDKSAPMATGTIYHPMLEAGSTATEWEPGYQFPSPDYPQPIMVARGRNLLDYTTFVQGTINGQGVDINTDLRLRSPFVEVNPQATYAISVNGSVGSSLMYVFEVNEYNASKSWLRAISVGATNYVYHPNSDAQYVKILLRIGNNSVITVNDIVWFQLELGSTATSYEPYTGGIPSPNPSYPQEIKVARGRNLLDESTLRQGDYNSTTTATRISTNLSDRPQSKAGVTYTLSYPSDINGWLFFTDESNAIQYGMPYVFKQPSPISVTAPSDGYRLTVIFGKKTPTEDAQLTPSDVTWAQLELGTTPTPYVPYGHVGLEVDYAPYLTADKWLNGSIADATGAHNDGNPRRIRNTVGGNYVPLAPGVQYSISLNSGYNCAVYAYDDDGAYVKSDTTLDWITPGVHVYTPSTATRGEIVVRKADDANISPSDIANAGLVIRTVTTVPLPSKGFLGALPDGTKDTLTIDSAGGVVVENTTNETVLDGTENWYLSGGGKRVLTNKLSANSLIRKSTSDAVAQPIMATRFQAKSSNETYGGTVGISIELNGNVGTTRTGSTTTAADEKAWYTSNPVTVLYPLATPTTESLGYIDLPALPEGATVTIPELENVGVDYWVSGIPEVTEYGQAMQARLQSEIDEAEQKVVDLAEMLGNMIKLSSINTIEFSETSSGTVGIRFKQDDRNYKDIWFDINGISCSGKVDGGLVAYWDIHA